MKTEKLAQRLNKLGKAYAEGQLASDYYFYEEKSLAYCQITLSNYKLEFVYSLKGNVKYPISTLSCRVYLKKDSPLFFEIPELIDYLDIYDYHCYCFPYIENYKRMDACFSYITDFLEYRSEELNSACEIADELLERKLAEIKRVFSYSDKLEPADKASKEAYNTNIFRHYSDFIVARYTSAKPYVNFVGCYFSAALDGYDKIEEKTGYEQKLVDFMIEQNAPYQAVTPECASILDVQEYMHSDAKTSALLIIVSILGFCFLFILLQLLVNLGYMAKARFVDYSNPFIAGICGIIPGITGAIVLRKRLEPFLRPNKKQALDFYDLLSTSSGTKLPQIAMAVAIALSLIVFIGICRPTLAVFDNYINYNEKHSIFVKYEKYELLDYKRTYLIKGYYTDKNYTNYVEDPHYVFAFSNKRYINASDLTITDEEFNELKNIIDPAHDGYHIQEFPSVEDII